MLNESDCELPGKLADLIQQIDRRQCRRVRVVQFTGGDLWLLRWEEKASRNALGERVFGRTLLD